MNIIEKRKFAIYKQYKQCSFIWQWQNATFCKSENVSVLILELGILICLEMISGFIYQIKKIVLYITQHSWLQLELNAKFENFTSRDPVIGY